MRTRTLVDGGRGLQGDRGSVGVWARGPIVLTQLTGFGDGSFADPIIAALDEALTGKGPIHFFLEMTAMENYDSALRTRLTNHVSQNRPRVASLQVVARSKLVTMGVAVANLALGGLITNHGSLSAFQAALDRAIAEAKVSGLSSAALAR